MTQLTRRTFLHRSIGLGAACALLATLRPAAATAATLAAPAVQVAGAVMTVAQELDPVSLDPHKSSNFSAVQGFEHVYESLTQYDENLNVQPALAESWEMSADGRQYTFNLRRGVMWHDGTEFTAEDVRYWHERMMSPATVAPYKNWFDAIERMEVVDRYTARAYLPKPYPPLLATFAAMRGGAITQAGAAEHHNLATTAVGTGPFKLVEYVPQSHLRFVKNPNYWNAGLPYLDEVMMKIVPEEDTRVAALRAGQVDYAFLSQEGADRVRADRNITVLESPKAWLTVAQFNTSRAPFNDVRVRQALRMALDPNEIIQKAVSGAATPSGPVPTGHSGWFIPPAQLKYQTPDPAGAQRLLAEAGATGQRFTILASPQYPEFVSTALVMQDAYKRIGLDPQVQQLEWGTFVRQVNAPNFDYDISITARTFYPDPDHYTFPYFHSASVNNPNKSYSNSTVDDLLERGRTIADPTTRLQIYTQLQQLLEDELPHMWFYSGINIEAVRNTVKGYVPSFTGRRISLKATWLDG